METLCSFRLVLEGKTGKEIPEPSRLELLEKFLVNNFALSDAEDNTSGPLNRGGIADLPLLRTLLAIRQKSRESKIPLISRQFLSLSTLFLVREFHGKQNFEIRRLFTINKIVSAFLGQIWSKKPKLSVLIVWCLLSLF